MSPRPLMDPVPLSERIEFLDVLRGAALFGIIAANMRAFNSPMPAYFDHSLMWTGTVDRITQGFIDFFISGKFITLFSFLFGIGFAVQMDRSAVRGVDPKTFYLRRLTVLLVFGLLHAFLLWSGDILAPYALCGFVLFLFRKSSDRTILTWAAITYAWPVALAGFMLAASSAGAGIPMPPRTTPEEISRIVDVYSAGTYAQMFQERLKELAFSAMGIVFYYPRLLGLFLVGLWVYRSGIVRDFANRADLLRRCQTWGLAIGVLGNGAMVAIDQILHPDPMAPTVAAFLYGLAGSIGVPAMSLFYASTLALLFARSEWRARLLPFGAVGRMALTNYLMQSLICTTLYNSWGLGLYGQVSPLLGLIPTFVIYSGQLLLSVWWTKRHTYGPMEWLWRKLTYGRVERGESPAAVAGA